jgi:hypothetical protein
VRSQVPAQLVQESESGATPGSIRFDEGECPQAAPSRLEEILVRIEGGVGEPGQHRPQRSGQARLVAGETQIELVGHSAMVTPLPTLIGRHSHMPTIEIGGDDGRGAS